MSNTGYVKYATLVELYTDTGLPTGQTKDNSITDPDYIPPIFDPVACPPDVIVPIVNNINVQFKNSSAQSFYLTNIEVVASSLTPSDSYLSLPSLGILPANSYFSAHKTQGGNFVNIRFTVLRASFDTQMECKISYRRPSVGSFIVERTFFVNVGDDVAQYLVETPFETSGTNLNNIKIEFT